MTCIAPLYFLLACISFLAPVGTWLGSLRPSRLSLAKSKSFRTSTTCLLGATPLPPAGGVAELGKALCRKGEDGRDAAFNAGRIQRCHHDCGSEGGT
jgi:hypothetical protein